MRSIIGEDERVYLARISKHTGEGVHAHYNSPQEGFEYFQSQQYLLKSGSHMPTMTERLFMVLIMTATAG